MAREYFINPYTFVPLDKNGPLLTPPDNSDVHLFFDPTRFTGIIKVELTFVTPAVIPGKQVPGSDIQPGWIEAYRYGNQLAIPGSRIRGQLLNLMRAINSSPLVHLNDWDILRREGGDPFKGVIIQSPTGLKVRRIDSEILVKDPDRRSGPNLSEHCTPEVNPVAYNGTSGFLIPDHDKFFGEDGTMISSPPSGVVYWQYAFERRRENTHKMYLAIKDPGAKNHSGCWIKLPCWSGQDCINELKDQNGISGAHKNAWHIVNTRWITKQDCELPQKPIDSYIDGVEREARLLEDRGEKPDLVRRVRAAKELKPGMFVYFMTDDSRKMVKSFGRHYRYLTYRGSVEAMIDSGSNNGLVEGLSGCAKDKGGPGLKGRLWVEMAFLDEQGNTPPLEERDLRILSSQPPKSKNFYLEGGDYGDHSARLKGRKFYWNDPLWSKKMWDNEDLKEGQAAFDNPTPAKLCKQWSRAEVIMATEDKPVSFSFNIRVMNLSQDERYLLLTAIVGFEPMLSDGSLRQTQWQNWCHKIGHARPFMGSAFMKITKVQQLEFDPGTLQPMSKEFKQTDLDKWKSELTSWQTQSLKGGHLEAIKRVMEFNGARKGLPENEYVPITYPLGQEPRNADGKTHITWIDKKWRALSDEQQPKTYVFFTTTQRNYTPPALPKAEPGVDQRLPVKFGNPSPGTGGDPRRDQQNRQPPGKVRTELDSSGNSDNASGRRPIDRRGRQ